MSDKRVVCAKCYSTDILENREDNRTDAYFFKCNACKRPVGVLKLSIEEIKTLKDNAIKKV